MKAFVLMFLAVMAGGGWAFSTGGSRMPAAVQDPNCGYCRPCGPDKMEADPNTENGIAWPQTCDTEICHPNADCCSPIVEDEEPVASVNTFEDLTAAIRAASSTSIRALLFAYKGHLRFNPRRQAVQLFGRSGQIVGHYGLSPEQAGGLEQTVPSWALSEEDE